MTVEKISDGTVRISGGDIENVTTIHPQNITFEGSSDDDFETTLRVIDPTTDRTILLANSSGTLIPFTNSSTTTISATPEELNLLSGTTLGIVGPNDIVSVDSNRDVTGIRNITAGTSITAGTVQISGGDINNLNTIHTQNVTFEGTTEDDFETTLGVVNPTTDRTINFANSSGTLIPFTTPSTTTISATPEEIKSSSGTTLGNVGPNDILSVDSNRNISGIKNMTIDGTFTNGAFTFDQSGVFSMSDIQCDRIIFEGNTNNDYETTIGVIDPTGDRTVNIADVSGTLVPFSFPYTMPITASPIEINYLDGVTSNIQEQINSFRNGFTLTSIEYNGGITTYERKYTNASELVFSEVEGFKLVNGPNNTKIVKNLTANLSSIWTAISYRRRWWNNK